MQLHSTEGKTDDRRREEMKRGGERERKKSPSLNAEGRAFKWEPFFQEQIAALPELFKGSDDKLSWAPF